MGATYKNATETQRVRIGGRFLFDVLCWLFDVFFWKISIGMVADVVSSSSDPVLTCSQGHSSPRNSPWSAGDVASRHLNVASRAPPSFLAPKLNRKTLKKLTKPVFFVPGVLKKKNAGDVSKRVPGPTWNCSGCRWWTVAKSSLLVAKTSWGGWKPSCFVGGIEHEYNECGMTTNPKILPEIFLVMVGWTHLAAIINLSAVACGEAMVCERRKKPA